jgi:hypothetical protein
VTSGAATIRFVDLSGDRLEALPYLVQREPIGRERADDEICPRPPSSIQRVAKHAELARETNVLVR